MTQKAKNLLQEVCRELGARWLVVAHESGEALLIAGQEASSATTGSF